jgi:hypothetical protein
MWQAVGGKWDVVDLIGAMKEWADNAINNKNVVEKRQLNVFKGHILRRRGVNRERW